MTTLDWASSTANCHVTLSHWSNSASGPHSGESTWRMGPTGVPRGRPWQGHLTQSMPCDIPPFNHVTPSRDTWPDLIGPHHNPHQHCCHLAVCVWFTAVRRGAKWQHTENPPYLCMPHGSLLLVHLTTVGPTMPQDDWQVDPTWCHLAGTDWCHVIRLCTQRLYVALSDWYRLAQSAHMASLVRATSANH
jgi:hypothetical protein